ncbi:MAG: hypothetical protein ACPGN3_15820 [Opitutales bacterium]
MNLQEQSRCHRQTHPERYRKIGLLDKAATDLNAAAALPLTNLSEVSLLTHQVRTDIDATYERFAALFRENAQQGSSGA